MFYDFSVYLPQTDEVGGNFILRHLDLGEVIHAKTNKVEAWDCRSDHVVRDFGVLRSRCKEAILGSIEQFVTAHFDVLTADDEDVEARESADGEARDRNVFDRLRHRVYAFVLVDEVGQIEAATSYANACLAGSVVVGLWVDWPCKIGTFVLDSGFRWD